eukprot:jgi/Mesen1/5943/ME000301S05074
MAVPLDAMAAAFLGQGKGTFEPLVEQLMSPSNDVRGQAEAVFNQCKQHPDALVTKLVETLRSSPKAELRGLCAVLLRKVITKDQVSLWPVLNAATQNGVKSELLLCVQGEEVKSITKKLCDTVSELAAGIFEDGNWPELLPFMFECVSSSTDRLRESALFIFAQLAQYIGDSLHPYLGTLHGLLQQSLASSSSNDVRIAALRATASFVQTLENSQERDGFQDLLPGMLQTLSLALQSREEPAAQEALELFIEIAGSEPRFLRRQLQQVVDAMLSIADNAELEEATCHLAVEFLITLAEAREQAPGMMRKLPNFVGRLFAILMKLLLDIEDDPAWHTADSEDEDAGESSNYEVGQECLDRLAIALGGNSVIPVASQLLPEFLRSTDWRHRHAALVCLAQVAEGCSKVMVKNIASVVAMILGAFGDAHPRVRWAAINAIGQLSTDLGPDLQQKSHQQVLPALVAAMDDFNNPRVQAHASAAILNFSEASTAAILGPYLDGIISKLLVLLQNGKKMVQEGALTALAAVADCGQESFQKYYDTVMPFLKTILMNANDKEHRMLRAKSMECISLVGMAVMDVLMSLQGADMDADDPTISYMLQAWARLCKCLGQEFLPYMGVVMPPLLHSAQLKPDVTIVDADDDDVADDDDDDSVETITIGDKKIGIRTSVAPIMVPLLKFYFHEEVRKAAVSAMPELLRAGQLAVEKGQAAGRDRAYVKQLTDYLIPPLEPEPELCANMLDALGECIQIAGSLLDEAQVKSIVEELAAVFKQSRERKAERAQRRQTEDFDDEEKEILEEENEQDDELFDQVGEVAGTLMKAFKAPFEPMFASLASTLLPLMRRENHTKEERRVAICIFDDIAEHLGEASLKYYAPFVPVVLECCVDQTPDIRQAAVYGIGLCAQYGGAAFQPYLQDSVVRLLALVRDPDARSSQNEMATDNAVSALGKICEHQQGSYDSGDVLAAYLGYLPLRGDTVEAKIVHAQLCSYVERSDPRILGPNNQNLPKVVAVFAEVLMDEANLATEQIKIHIRSLLQRMQQSLPPDALAATWANLTPQQQAALHLCLAPPTA